MRPVTLLTLLLLACALPASAAPRATRARALLILADSSASLRSQLLSYADSASAAGDRVGAGEALGYAATSFQRDGRLDSAIVCHRRAFELLGEEALLPLVDQLLLRHGAGDAAEVIRLLAAKPGSARKPATVLTGRIAWARFLQGKPDTAAALFATAERWLLPGYEWRYRMARVALARKDYRRVITLLMPDAVGSRGTDEEVIDLLEQAGNELNLTPKIQVSVLRQTVDRDQPEIALAAGLHGRLVELTASDGFPLGGLLVPAPRARTPRGARRAPARLAVVLMAPGDTLASGDSLVVALRRHGITTLLLHLRGYGTSVGPSCPSPDAWFDREAALQGRIARDVRDAVRGVARLSPVDDTRYLVAGVGASATMAVEAATLDPRVKALLLVSPAPALVDRGLTRARLARLRPPVFFQIAPDDFDASLAITNVLYQAGDRSSSRVVESSTGGQGLAQFRADPTLAGRFLTWLDATLPPPAPPRAGTAPRRPTPPAPRRR